MVDFLYVAPLNDVMFRMVRLGLWAAPSPIFAKITGPSMKQEQVNAYELCTPSFPSYQLFLTECAVTLQKVGMEVQDGEGTNTSSSDQR